MEDKIRVLIADDLESERMLLKLAFRNAHGFEIVGEVEDGLQVIRYLSGEGDFADRKQHPWPDILFLDLKMPKRSGFEVLDWIKKSHLENELKVVVFTSSDEESDRTKAFVLGADRFQVKPLGPQEYIKILENLKGLYWQGALRAS